MASLIKSLAGAGKPIQERRSISRSPPGVRLREMPHDGGIPVGTRDMGDAVLAALERRA